MEIIEYKEFPNNVLVEMNGKKEIIKFREVSKDGNESLWFTATSFDIACYALKLSTGDIEFKPITLSTEIVTNIKQYKSKYGRITTTCA